MHAVMPVERLVDNLVGGRFLVRELHRRGATGELYDAYDQATGERVALKILRPGAASPERIDREARILSDLEHPGIVRHIAHGTTERGRRYLAMEWLDGEDLSERLRRERLTLTEVVALGGAVARALSAAHANGVVHRDLRPSHVFLPGFRAARAKVLDFGLAQATDSARELTRSGAVLGSRGYVAPEQLLGDRPRVGPKADLFALGCILYELLAHRAPFDAPEAREVVRRILFDDPEPIEAKAPGVPAELADLVRRLLAKDVDDRPESADEVAARLGALPLPTRGEAVRLQVLLGPDVGLLRLVGDPRMDIGKHPSATLPLRDGSVARFHCEIVRGPSALEVRDLGGPRGLLVDGARVSHATLREGAVLGLGESRVRVERVADAELGLSGAERARTGEMNVLLEGAGWDARAVAQRLHEGSGRRRGPHLAVYGSAFRAEDLAHASGGTLLLEEPEALAPAEQRALARFVETRAVATARGPVHADVRIVTHAPNDLRPAVNARRFPPELFHALAALRLALPS